ncbi:MAG: hypothetical protein ACOYNL_00405 [Rickettsiales bacterium]
MSLDTAAPAQATRATVPVISAAGVNDAAALARQQLPTAVPAPTLIAAYAAHTPPVPAKPAPKAATAPSSALAAQFIAQDTSLTQEELAIFAPRTPNEPTTDEAQPDDYLSALRATPGEIVPVKNKQAAAVKNAPAPQPSVEANQQTEFTTRSLTQLATSLPSLLSQFIRRPSIATARGLPAYQLAEARNVTTARKPAAAEVAS